MTSNPLPVIGPIPQALLLCSRETLSPRQEEHIVSLCWAIDDWPAFVQQAEFRLVLPLAHRHLARLRPPAVPASVMETLKERAMRIVLRNLTLAAVHHRMAREVLEPLQVPYAFKKGLTLAYRYYREPGLRMARDIDVLVHRHDLVRVGQRLRQLGFTIVRAPPGPDDDALRFRARFLGLMAWVSPEGVLVEIPSSIDQEWGRLPTERIIASAESVSIGGLPVSTLHDLDQFVYICVHHTYHHWARLHWIADLDAIARSPGFDLAAERDHAKRHGFDRTVGAALAIARAAAEPEPWKAEFEDRFAREVFRHCLMNLEGDFEQERGFRTSFPTRDVDIAPGRRWLQRVVGRNLGRFRPRGADYQQLRLGHRWHSAYYALRPFLWTIRKLRGAGRRR